VAGRVLLVKDWEWGRSIPRDDRDQILERIYQPTGWIDNRGSRSTTTRRDVRAEFDLAPRRKSPPALPEPAPSRGRCCHPLRQRAQICC
jgi:hypothetical protein